MVPIVILLAAIVGIILLVAIWAVLLYNSLVGKRVYSENAWSQIDVQLKRRYDLIPNLIETVKGYAAHERGTLEAVTKARQQAIDATGVKDQAQAENLLTGALRQVFALQENYPDLKANQSFLSLQEELASTENKIGFARQHYNDVAGQYNTTIQLFPAVLFAAALGFKPRDFFAVDTPQERQAPQVKF